MYVITVLFVTTLITFQNGYVRGCSPCFCYSDMDNLTVVLCEGMDVVEFPTLPPGIVTSVSKIHITNTLIQCLPKNTSSQYVQLKMVGESENVFWQCTCMDMWILNLPNEVEYVTEKCAKDSTTTYITTMTPTISSTTFHMTEPNPTLITSRQEDVYISTPTFPTPPIININTMLSLIILILIICTVTIFIALHCLKFYCWVKGRKQRRVHSPISLRNDSYYTDNFTRGEEGEVDIWTTTNQDFVSNDTYEMDELTSPGSSACGSAISL